MSGTEVLETLATALVSDSSEPELEEED